MYISAYRPLVPLARALPTTRFAGAAQKYPPGSPQAELHQALTSMLKHNTGVVGISTNHKIYRNWDSIYALTAQHQTPQMLGVIMDTVVEHMFDHKLGQPNDHAFTLLAWAAIIMTTPSATYTKRLHVSQETKAVVKDLYKKRVEGLLPQQTSTTVQPLTPEEEAVIEKFFDGDSQLTFANLFGQTLLNNDSMRITMDWLLNRISEQLPDNAYKAITTSGIALDAILWFFKPSDAAIPPAMMPGIYDGLQKRLKTDINNKLRTI